MAVTSIPVLISDSRFGVSTLYGPYLAGGALYVVLGETVAGGQLISVYKSTDSGVTWVSQDAGSRPTIANNGTYSVIFQPATINLLYANLGVPNVLGNATYNISTDLFVSPVTVPVVHDLVAVQLSVQRSDGSIVVMYNISDTSVEALYFNTFSAGSWGTETLLTQGLASQNLNSIAAVVDGSDITHLLWELTAMAVDTVKYQTIDAGGGVSGSVAFPISNFDLGLKSAAIWSGVLVFPFVDTVTFLARTAFATGATSNPASASWTSADDWTGTLPIDSNNNSTAVPLLDSSGDLQVVFINNSVSAGNKVYSVRWGGAAFDTPVLFYDPATYPPPGTASTVFLFLISLALDGANLDLVFGAAYGGPNASTFFAGGGGAQSGYRNKVY